MAPIPGIIKEYICNECGFPCTLFVNCGEGDPEKLKPTVCHHDSAAAKWQEVDCG